MPFGAIFEHVPCSGEHGSGHGDDGLLGTPTGSDAVELRLQITALDAHGGPGGLNKRGFEPMAAAPEAMNTAAALDTATSCTSGSGWLRA